MIVDKISAYLTQVEGAVDYKLRYEVGKLAEYAFQRQFMSEGRETPAGTLRLSSAGACVRKNAYVYHGFPKMGKETDSRAKMIFWLGDLAELTVVSLAKLSGCCVTATGLNQIEVKLNVGGREIVGHPDGLFILDGIRLLEVKSMTSYRFEEFERGKISEEYLDQINCYLEALNINECVIVALNKESGVMHELLVVRDPIRIKRIKKNLKLVLDSTEQTLPDKPFAPDKNGILPWNCLYCAYWGHCWPGAETKLVKNSYKLITPKTVEVQK